MPPIQLLFDAINYELDMDYSSINIYQFRPISKLFIKMYKKLLYTSYKHHLLVLAIYDGKLSIIKKMHMLDSQLIYTYCDIYYPAKRGYFTVVKYLCENGARVDDTCFLVGACEEGNLDIIRYLNEQYMNTKKKNPKNFNWDTTEYDELIKIASLTNLDMVKYLHSCGANISAENNMPIMFASSNGKLEIVKYFHENGVDITARDNAAICNAAYYGYFEIVKYLHENGADITARNNFSIYEADKNGHYEIVNYLLNHGAGFSRSSFNELDFCK